MRILWTGTFLPYPPVDGGRLVAYHQLEGLARRGHELTIVVPLRRPDDAANVAALERFATVDAFATRARTPAATAVTALVRGESLRVERHRLPEAPAAIRAALAEPPDVVFVDNLFTAHVVPTVRAAAPHVPVVLLEHNCESRVFARLADEAFPWRLLGSWESPRIEAAERRALGAVDRVLTLSEPDRDVLQALLPGARIEVCGSGTPLPPRERLDAGRPGGNVVLFLATYLYPPNVDAARWLAGSIWPRVRERVPGARLVLAGNDPDGKVAALADPALRIEAPGFVPDATDATLAARVAVAPLRAGSGVRLKILEALAHERPLVATTVGAEGLDLVPGEHLLVADDGPAFADAIVRLLESPDEAGRLAAAGRARVAERYSWDAACDRLERILARVVARDGAVA